MNSSRVASAAGISAIQRTRGIHVIRASLRPISPNICRCCRRKGCGALRRSLRARALLRADAATARRSLVPRFAAASGAEAAENRLYSASRARSAESARSSASSAAITWYSSAIPYSSGCPLALQSPPTRQPLLRDRSLHDPGARAAAVGRRADRTLAENPTSEVRSFGHHYRCCGGASSRWTMSCRIGRSSPCTCFPTPRHCGTRTWSSTWTGFSRRARTPTC